MLAHAQPRLTVIDGRKPDKRTAVSDLVMEVRAAGQEMVSLGQWLENALAIGDIHTAMHISGRLRFLGGGYADYGTNGGAA